MIFFFFCNIVDLNILCGVWIVHFMIRYQRVMHIVRHSYYTLHADYSLTFALNFVNVFRDNFLVRNLMERHSFQKDGIFDIIF